MLRRRLRLTALQLSVVLAIVASKAQAFVFPSALSSSSSSSSASSVAATVAATVAAIRWNKQKQVLSDHRLPGLLPIRFSSPLVSPSKADNQRQKQVLLASSSSSVAETETSIATSTMHSAIGFIGLGIMGEGMASCLINKGVAGTEATPLIIWNRTGSKCEAFKEKFIDKVVVIMDSPREVVESCSVIYSMMSTPEASKVVFEGEDGVLAGISENKAIIDCATLAEEDMERMSTAVIAAGGRFLEAPVSGSKVPAATGTLIFLCAGDKALFDEVYEGGLTAMGKASHFFSTEVGHGTRAKLVINSLMGTMVAAFGEGLALSESVGLDPTKIIEVIGQGAIQSPVYGLKGPKMIVKDHAPNFPLKHAHKDMALACEMAKKAGVEYTVMEKAEELFRSARDDSDLNLADEDFSAVFEKIHKDSTSDFSKDRMKK